jgi:hypothetical protein
MLIVVEMKFTVPTVDDVVFLALKPTVVVFSQPGSGL